MHIQQNSAGAFITRSKVLLAIAGILLLSLLIACAPKKDDDGGGGGSDDTYTVGGTVTGHTGEVSLALTYGEKTETLEVPTGTDKFTFDAKLVANQSFTIAVAAPDGQSCSSSVTQGSIVNANITDISVTCVTVPAYSVGGTVAGHTGEVSLALTYGEETETLKVAVGTDKFTFLGKLTANQSFTIAVGNPEGQSCRSSLTEGTIVDANVTNVEVTCVASTYSVGGTVSGLAENETVTLTLSPTVGTVETEDVIGDADETADEPFTFDTRLLNSATYEVTTTSPTGKYLYGRSCR